MKNALGNPCDRVPELEASLDAGPQGVACPFGVLAVMFAAAAACGSTDATFSSRFASGFAPAHHVVSVLGAYRDGQMSADTWNSIGPQISPSLGGANCDAAYAFALVSTDRAVSSAIDDYTRSNGPTDDLLAHLAPAAKGDLILVLTLAGTVRLRSNDPASPASISGSPAIGGRSPAGGARGGGIAPSGPEPRSQSDAFEMSASLFSVALRRSVALVGMQYSGASADEAVAQFAARLAQVLPGTTCAGWNWDAKIDAEQIRKDMRE
jgi:hypothetical protein